MLKDTLSIVSNMHLILRDGKGRIKDERFIHNTVTTAGKNGVAAMAMVLKGVK